MGDRQWGNQTGSWAGGSDNKDKAGKETESEEGDSTGGQAR